MAGPGFTNLFNGQSILPSWPAYLAIDLTADTLLGWPTEVNAGNGAVVAEILEVTAAAGGLTLQLSSAEEVGLGYSFLVNNVGANTFSVLDNAGGVIASIASGTVWQIYCADNSTVAGTWRIFQYGAGASSANAAALAGSGLKAITTTLNERIFVNAQSVAYAIQNSDRASLVEWTGTGGGAFTLPNPATVGSDWFCYIKNAGGASLTVTPAAGSINSAANQTFQVNDSAIVVCDGANYWTIGFGQSLSSTFNFVTINLAGLSGTYTLAGANLNRISYNFTGALAGNITVVVPASIQQYWVNNSTSGAYTLTVASSGVGGATVAVPQGTSTILYCDGLNIIQAISSAATTPQFPDGSAAAPGITFTSDTALGFYKAGTDTLGFASAGVSRGTMNATGNWVLNAASSGTTLTLTGGLSVDTLTSSGNGTVTGTLTVDQEIYADGAGTGLDVLNNALIGGTLGVTGAITGGTYNGQTISAAASLTGSLSVATTLTLGGTLFAAPLTVERTGAVSGQVLQLTSNTPAGTTISDIVLDRVSTTANTVAQGASFQFTDTTAGTSSLLQHAGGQTELWQSNGAWKQLAVWNTSGGLALGAPSAGLALTVTGGPTTAVKVLTEAGQYGLDIDSSASGALTGIAIVDSNIGWGLLTSVTTAGSLDIRNNNLNTPVMSFQGLQGYIRDDNGSLQLLGYRGTPQATYGAVNHTLTIADRAKMVRISSGFTLTVPANVFSAGDVVPVAATFTGGGTMTIAQGAGLTLYWANGTLATGNRTLTDIALATIYFDSPTVAYISGSGLS